MTLPSPDASYGTILVKSWGADNITSLVTTIQAWLDMEQGLLLHDLTYLLHLDLQTLTLRALFMRAGAGLGYRYRAVGVTGATLADAQAALAAHYAAYPSDQVAASISLPSRDGIARTGFINQVWFFIKGDSGVGFAGPVNVWIAEPVADIDPQTAGNANIWDASGNPLATPQPVWNTANNTPWPAGQRSFAIWDWGTGCLIGLPTGQDVSGGGTISSTYIYPLCIRGGAV